MKTNEFRCENCDKILASYHFGSMNKDALFSTKIVDGVEVQFANELNMACQHQPFRLFWFRIKCDNCGHVNDKSNPTSLREYYEHGYHYLIPEIDDENKRITPFGNHFMSFCTEKKPAFVFRGD